MFRFGKVKFSAVNFWLKIPLLLALCAASASFALQEKPVVNNGTATAFVSINGLTRIAVENDRISNIRGPQGAYESDTQKEDDQQGAVFIHPLENQKNPFTLFIATENNQNYLLRLTPQNRNADNILLKPRDSKNPQALHWEKATPYAQAIKQLMATMVKGGTLEGYGIEAITNSSILYLRLAPVKIRLIQIYQGAFLQGKIYCITNRSGHSVSLTETDFYQPGDRAIALPQPFLPPYGKTQLYKVVGYDSAN